VRNKNQIYLLNRPIQKPIINYETFYRRVGQSIAKGVVCLSDSEIPEGPGAFYPATVLNAVAKGMPAYEEKIFGPVADVIPVKNEKEIKMTHQFTLKLDNDQIRFTPDGKVAVVDAIKALSFLGDPETVWESLKAESPEINEVYQNYDFAESKSEAVVDGEGWEKIEAALLDYMLDHDCSS
jgi:hypothetical protein